MNLDTKLEERKSSLLTDGISGDEIFIIKNKDKNFVFKRSIKNSVRLEQNASKQKQFRPINNIEPISITQTSWDDDGSFGFIMPYISGLTGSNLIQNSSVHELQQITNSLLEMIKTFISASRKEKLISHWPIFSNKIESLKKEILANPFIDDQRFYDEIFSMPIIKLKPNNEHNILLGPNHGDLTFSNIIFRRNDNKIFLFDFLTSFIESPLNDIAKIEQEFIFIWSSRNRTKPLITKAKILGQHMFPKFSQLITPDLTYSYHLMSILNLLRILPYSTEEKTVDLVTRSLQQKLHQIHLIGK